MLAHEIRQEMHQIYHGYEYIPMGEASSLLIPLTVGCDYSKCLFCDLNHDLPFTVLDLQTLEKILVLQAEFNKLRQRKPRRVVFLHANPFALSTGRLLEASSLVKKYLPFIVNFGCFSRIDAVLAKSQAELRQLRAAGFDSLTLGIESGSDKVLLLHNKGVTGMQTRSALEKLERAGIAYSFYIILGLGGKELSIEHQEETAKLINDSHPEQVYFLSLVIFKNAALVDELRAGRFKRMRPLDCMIEAAAIIERINSSVIINGSHKNNIFSFKGKLPEQKKLLLERLYEDIGAYNYEDALKRDARRWQYWPNE